VSHIAYLGVLAFVLLGSAWLELALRARVFSRGRRLVLTLVPVVALFCLWDLYAISAGHWSFDPARTTGIRAPGEIPVEEVLFFVVVPIASLLTLEAVRSVRRWEVGDEPPGACADGVRLEDGRRAADPRAGEAS
jgi:lycopene cyclase domain-containing protein